MTNGLPLNASKTPYTIYSNFPPKKKRLTINELLVLVITNKLISRVYSSKFF